ncbi:MAG TPA: mandelate racemase/muconate lactonizing enzyme family protein [Roseiarcus sp.]|nr:mandelate racemase/muconate lactonizing enzyme family protein [Roseiarcus sp.]
MPKITRVEVFRVDLAAKVARSDAIQAFSKQETPMVRVWTDDGAEGTGYSYTIGTGGSAVVALIRDYMAPWLIGRDASMVEEIWKSLFFFTHANSVGATVSLALAAIDVALWDLRCKRANAPLHLVAGGAQRRVPVYNTEGGWLNFTTQQLVDHAIEAREAGFRGFKVKVGQPHVAEDVARLAAVRGALGLDFEVMVDANQAFTVSEAIRRAKRFEEFDLAWFEEPMPAEDIDGHVRLSRSTSIPIAIGESLYHPSHFREYLQRGGCSIVQVDVARIGGITPWLKTAHLAETFNMQVCPHYLMELHVGLCAAVPNATWVEFIPQLDAATESKIQLVDGYAVPSDEVGVGIRWDWKAIDSMKTEYTVIS